MNRLSIKILLLLIIVLLFVGVNCKDEPPVVPPEPPKKEITLTLTDTTCTEAWITVRFANFIAPHYYKLYRDTTLAFAGTLFANETTFVDEGLLPKRAYTYKALRLENNIAKDSTTVIATTMDTTSHEFTFTVDTLGGYGSVLRDVAIIDENNIWVVGEIYVKNTAGTVVDYNAARWDGMKWNLVQIPLRATPSPNSSTYPVPLQTIIVFASNEIYVSDGGQIVRYNGTNWGEWSHLFTDLYDTTFGGVNKLWGTSANDFWGVGNKGNIFHFNKTTWTKVSSPTTVNLKDIYGTPDGKQMWACGYYSDKRGTYLLKKEGAASWKIVYDGTTNRIFVRSDSISGALSTVFVPTQNRVMVGTVSGLYLATNQTTGAAKRLSFTPDYFPGFPTRLRGNGINDVTLCGAFSFIGHYNGYSWRNYSALRMEDGPLRSIAQKGNTIVAVGNLQDAIDGKGLIIHGKR